MLHVVRLLPVLLALVATGACAAATSAPPHDRQPGRDAPASEWALDQQPVPRTLDEALQALERGLGERTIERLRIEEEDIAIRLVPTLGRWVQDRWGLAAGGPLAQHFERLGLDHPDDMAAVILTSLWRRLHFRQIRLEEQIAWYQASRGNPVRP
jgi:hypothetical protein